MAPSAKKEDKEPEKKKKRGRRALKITNSHMKAHVSGPTVCNACMADNNKPTGYRLFARLRGSVITCM